MLFVDIYLYLLVVWKAQTYIEKTTIKNAETNIYIYYLAFHINFH